MFLLVYNDGSCFNSRTREGATRTSKKGITLISFNSRTREGATSLGSGAKGLTKFQFTHP